MAHKLADETLGAIMTLHLSVSDSAFSSTEGRSPFARVLLSSSALLLVCKRWMRIATPLLYNTVILRSTAQAQALALVLKTNPTFGLHIKKLRVEGGYGASVEKIIRAAKNITDFCMTLELWATDNVKGMCKAMPLMNPNRFVLISLNVDERNNMNTRLAQATACVCIKAWSNLTTVVLPATIAVSDDIDTDIIQSISTSTSLKRIILTGDTYNPQGVLNVFAAIPNVEAIDVSWPESRNMTIEPSWTLFGLKAATLSEEAKSKVRYAQESDNFILPADLLTPVDMRPLDPTYRPMQSASQEDRRFVWSAIIEHVIRPTPRTDDMSSDFEWSSDDYETSDNEYDDFYDPYFVDRVPRRKSRIVTCMLVCKEFKAAATEVACRDLALTSWEALSSFRRLIDREPQLASLVRTLRLGQFESEDGSDLNEVVLRIKHVRTVTVSAKHSYTVSLPFDILNYILVGSGGTVQQINSIFFTGSAHMSTFAEFRALVSLEWNGSANFPLKDKVCLPALRNISLCTLNSSFLSALTVCELPLLEKIEFGLFEGGEQFRSKNSSLATFLRTHGDKIRKLVQTGQDHTLDFVLSKCPNIVELKFATQSFYGMYHISPTALSDPHPSLNRIDMPHSLGDKIAIDKWSDFLCSINSKRFPALRVVSVPNTAFWPTTQREISKSPWPRIAETLLESGIHMTDGDGIPWRPRLQPTSTRKK